MSQRLPTYPASHIKLPFSQPDVCPSTARRLSFPPKLRWCPDDSRQKTSQTTRTCETDPHRGHHGHLAL